jgi:hypothetical protein
MFSYEILSIITRAIESELAHPPSASSDLPRSEEEIALKILNALEEAGYKVVTLEQQQSG